jgi:hypothetical protein
MHIYNRKMLLALQAHNMGTTTLHMRVDPSVWGPPSCEGLLCPCCGLVVQQSNLYIITTKVYMFNQPNCFFGSLCCIYNESDYRINSI